LIYPVVIIGGGGHARVVHDTLLQMKKQVIGYISPEPESPMGATHLGNDDVLCHYPCDEVILANGIGGIVAGGRRVVIFEALKSRGYFFITLIHPSAVLGGNVSLGEGCQIMAGSVIQTGAKCADNVVINTRAGIDHDCTIGAHTHISVGATLSGSVSIGKRSFVGAGSTLIQGVSVGDDCLVAAGSVVVTNVEDAEKVVGVPAYRMKK